MNETLKTARRPDGLPFMLLLVMAFVVAMGLFIRDYRSPQIQARIAIEQKLQKEGRFSPEVRRNVPLRMLQ